MSNDYEKYNYSSKKTCYGCRKQFSEFELLEFLIVCTCKQYRKYKQHHDTAGVNHHLNRAEECVPQKEIQSRSTQKGKEQEHCRADNTLCCNRENGESEYRKGKNVKYY